MGEFYSNSSPMYGDDDLARMLKQLEQDGGFTDLYLAAGEHAKYKRNKKLTPFTRRPLKEQEIAAFLYAATQDRAASNTIKTDRIALSGAFSIGGKKQEYHHRYRYEASLARDGYGKNSIALDIRSLSASPVPLSAQNVDPILIQALVSKEPGIGLIGGATGSGKTTLLSGVIDDALRSGSNDRVVRTIEDPIEITYDDGDYGHNSLRQRELHTHFKTFGQAIRSFLRQGPTDILVGELRDLETIQEALKASRTGHRVFATIHVNTVPEIPARIVSEFPEESRKGRMLELIGISNVWMVQRLEVNPKGGLTAIREYLPLNRDLVNQLFDVHPDDIRKKANELLHEFGKPMEVAALEAFEAGNIDELTYQRIKGGA